MGLLSKMFGGGTNLEVSLDATQVPAGGVLSGRATLHGGKKDLELTALKVRLLYVSVQSKEDSPIPDIDTRILLDNTIAANQAIPAGSVSHHDFQFTIPSGTEVSAHNVSYKVMVTADIPKVKDPSAEADLKVVEAAAGGAALSITDIYGRWPALQGTATEPLCDALRDFRNECYSERETLIAAEPVLASLIRQQSGEVRELALDAWSNLLDGQARKEHLHLLQELSQQDLDKDMTKELIGAAAKFADEGALPVIQGYAQHADNEIRKEVADQLRFAAEDKFKGKRELLVHMAQDGDPEVRASVFGAFSDFRDDRQIMEMVAGQIDRDPSAEVQKACIGALSLAHHYGSGDITKAVYERHLQNPNEIVRKEIGEDLHWFPEEDRQWIGQIAQRLLADASEEVRRNTAWYFRNMRKFPELAPMLRHVSENDPAEKVRTDALGALAYLTQPAEIVPYYRARMQQQPTEPVMWAILDGLREHPEDPHARAFLQELTQAPFPRVANAAREALESDE